jgi:hypothetical protein
VIDTVPQTKSGGKASPLTCTVLAAGWNSIAIPDPAKLRGQVSAAFPATLSVGVLKQTDEQNLPALLALKQALNESGVTEEQCSDWGLVAVPRMPCRRRVAESLGKFRDQGAWSVSPHLVPNTSLHSASGLFSQALRLHGPNIGAGGMPGTESDGLWAALTLLEGERLPGVWLILTGWEYESLDAKDVRCQAAVLALQSGAKPNKSHLTFTPGFEVSSGPAFSLESLGESIRNRQVARWNVGGAACTISYRCNEQGVAA